MWGDLIKASHLILEEGDENGKERQIRCTIK